MSDTPNIETAEVVSVFRTDIEKGAFNRLRRIALAEGVPDKMNMVLRWAAMQFLKHETARINEAATETQSA